MNSVIVKDLIKGVIIGFIYFEITEANDTTFYNMLVFTAYYFVMVNISYLAGIESTIITNAFITKAIFTLVDERIRRRTKEHKNPTS